MKKEEREKLDREIKTGLTSIGCSLDLYSGDSGDSIFNKSSVFTEEEFGLCASCCYIFAIRTRWSKVRACCDFSRRQFFLPLNDPIKDCSCYSKKNLLSIDNMKEIATIIDINKKEKIGF